MAIQIFLDESGDLGWSFILENGKRGSSYYLTIASLIVPETKKHLPARVIRDLYTTMKWSTNNEKKWSGINCRAKHEFIKKACNFFSKHPEIEFHVIIVNKQKVTLAMRDDPNLLYNYMIKLSLIDAMKLHQKVTLMPDPRTIKIESGNSLHDYLQLNLLYEQRVETKLITKPMDSKKTLGIQFADLLAGAVQGNL